MDAVYFKCEKKYPVLVKQEAFCATLLCGLAIGNVMSEEPGSHSNIAKHIIRSD